MLNVFFSKLTIFKILDDLCALNEYSIYFSLAVGLL